MYLGLGNKGTKVSKFKVSGRWWFQFNVNKDGLLQVTAKFFSVFVVSASSY